jgi:arsenite methyltransferase
VTREDVRDRYAAAALKVLDNRASGGGCCDSSADDGCCGPVAEADRALGELYSASERAEVPGAAVEASLGCGNPLMVADLHEGETVLDLGSGGGIDVLLSARRVGPTGTAYGLDMTDEMLELARHANRALRAPNARSGQAITTAIPVGTPATSRALRTPSSGACIAP